jgi:Dyp-type peroxidase family
MSRSLDLADIQGNVLRPFGFAHGWHQFVRIDDADAGREWLGRLTQDYVSDATATAASNPSPGAGVNVALSAAGLAALGVPPTVLAGFSEEFRAGMAARADILGDRGPSDPTGWRDGFGPGAPDRPRPPLAMVSAYSDDKGDLKDLVGRLYEESTRAGVLQVQELPVGRLEKEGREKEVREHFGFADGFAQPEVEGAPPSRRAALRGKPLPAGEFLIGHRDVEYALAPGPAGPLGRNGTYLVYRELAQDVAGFRRYLQDQARATGLGPDMVGAKMVGRWADGSPLMVTPKVADPSMAGEGREVDPRINDFTYGSDLNGIRCPLGAHIRRVNPRDALGFGDRLSRRHRMIRRGMPYGPGLPDDTVENDGEERGLAFICLVASIRRQFEFVQAQWCNDGNAFGLGVERDALVGQGARAGDGPGKITVPGSPPCFLSPAPELVHTRGGEYFFLPSLTGLRFLSESRWS